jgi:hypothetical protein
MWNQSRDNEFFVVISVIVMPIFLIALRTNNVVFRRLVYILLPVLLAFLGTYAKNFQPTAKLNASCVYPTILGLSVPSNVDYALLEKSGNMSVVPYSCLLGMLDKCIADGQSSNHAHELNKRFYDNLLLKIYAEAQVVSQKFYSDLLCKCNEIKNDLNLPEPSYLNMVAISTVAGDTLFYLHYLKLAIEHGVGESLAQTLLQIFILANERGGFGFLQDGTLQLVQISNGKGFFWIFAHLATSIRNILPLKTIIKAEDLTGTIIDPANNKIAISAPEAVAKYSLFYNHPSMRMHAENFGFGIVGGDFAEIPEKLRTPLLSVGSMFGSRIICDAPKPEATVIGASQKAKEEILANLGR